MSRKLVLTLAALLLVAGAGVYEVMPAGASSTLDHCFSYGTPTGTQQAAYTKICLSNHGNISSFIAPAGKEHIRQGYFGEGYAICSNNGSTVHGWDAGDNESAWGASTVGSGPTITRTTSDGAFKIKQTFVFRGVEGELAITMAVTNTSGVQKSNVLLSRYFDGDVDGTFNERGATSSASVFEWLEQPGHGLKLTAQSFAVFHRTYVEDFATWSSTRSGCVASPLTTPAGPADLTGRLNYTLGTINAGQTKTVIFGYERI